MQKGIIIIIFLFIFIAILIYNIAPKYYNQSDNPILNKVRANYTLLNPDYAKIPLREGDSAYTEDKSVITLCLKNPHTLQHYDMNTIMYVALHELSHVLSPKWEKEQEGHGEEFRKIFSNVLNHATSIGIYDPRKEIPIDYCSTH